MILARSRHLPREAWSFPFAFIMVVLIVELYLIVFLRLITFPLVLGDSAVYDLLVELFTAGGVLHHGLHVEVMKLNVLLAVYAWVMSRTLPIRRDRVHRLALVGAALALLGFQLVLRMSPELMRLRSGVPATLPF